MMTIEDAKQASVPLINPSVYGDSDYAKLPEQGWYSKNPYIITTDKDCRDSHFLYCKAQNKLDLNNVLMRGSKGAIRYLNNSHDFSFGTIPKYLWPYRFAVRYLRILDKKIKGNQCVINVNVKRDISCESGLLTQLIFGFFAERDDLYGNSISTGNSRITEEKSQENKFLNRLNKYMAILMPDGKMYCFEGATPKYHAMNKLCQELKKCD